MADKQTEKNREKESNKDAAVKPDPETLNTTDPQEHMEGPVSSLMHKAGEEFESEEAEREAREKRSTGNSPSLGLYVIARRNDEAI